MFSSIINVYVVKAFAVFQGLAGDFSSFENVSLKKLSLMRWGSKKISTETRIEHYPDLDKKFKILYSTIDKNSKYNVIYTFSN